MMHHCLLSWDIYKPWKTIHDDEWGVPSGKTAKYFTSDILDVFSWTWLKITTIIPCKDRSPF